MMLFDIMIALAAYYVGRSGMGLQDFLELMDKLLKAHEEE